MVAVLEHPRDRDSLSVDLRPVGRGEVVEYELRGIRIGRVFKPNRCVLAADLGVAELDVGAADLASDERPPVQDPEQLGPFRLSP